MNISTGGPHILLFERDQQLTGLFISEFQLAGYECHTARTAVEVFDAIARQPIRLVLVNLAQAAAARREFWVALDTQRKGRGVQVLTFRCSNIANYGPRDQDENTPTMVDLEIDGMMGIMNLVDAVRARVPVGTTSAPENTLPRVLRSTGQSNSLASSSAAAASTARYAQHQGPARSASTIEGLSASQIARPALGSQIRTLDEPGFLNEAPARSPFSGQSLGTMQGHSPAQPLYPQPPQMAGSPLSTAYAAPNAGSQVAQNAYTQMGAPAQPVAQQPTYAQANNQPIPPAYTQSPSMPAQPTYAQPHSSSAQQAYPQAANPALPPTYTQANNPQAQQLYTQTNNPGGMITSSYASPANQGNQAAQSAYAPPATPSSPPGQSYTQHNIPGNTAANAQGQPTYTEKIRAVLYPNQRTWSPQGPGTPGAAQENYMPHDTQVATPPPGYQSATEPMGSALQRLANGQTGTDAPRESGLAQLSRMVQERNNAILESTNNAPAYQIPRTPAAPENYQAATLEQTAGTFYSGTTTANRPAEGPVTRVEFQKENAGAPTLRASPIQDLPGERTASTTGGLEVGKRPDVLSRTNYAQQPSVPLPPLASISAVAQPEEAQGNRQDPRARGEQNRSDIHPATRESRDTLAPARGRNSAEAPENRQNYETARPIKARVIPEPSQTTIIQETLIEHSPTPSIQTRIVPEHATPLQMRSTPEIVQAAPSRTYESEPTTAPRALATADSFEEVTSTELAFPTQETAPEVSSYSEVEENKRLLERAQAEIKVALSQHASFDTSNTPSNALLLDIMQSLPPMPAPPQQIQPQVLNGRATRSLGSVLLEGHLVPQNRLEVAQNVQRMLRGVDLNYQLGEILLMFKLLTPDQLLAASLVSYGLITATQISALGRIRQELHAIGLEYDLENLLIMFRILTPEQLREVRTNW